MSGKEDDLGTRLPTHPADGLSMQTMLSMRNLRRSATRCARAFSTAGAGLFNKKELQQPSDWVRYAQDTVQRSESSKELTDTTSRCLTLQSFAVTDVSQSSMKLSQHLLQHQQFSSWMTYLTM